jgi:hypothetical protein
MHACAGFKAGSIAVSRVKTNARCGYARKVIRTLLRNGVDGLPKAKASSRRWSCRKRGTLRVCKKAGRVGKVSKISFLPKDSSPVGQKGGTPPPPPPPPTNPPAPQVCLDLWNTYESTIPNLGIHFYADHNVRQAWVYLVTDPQGGQRCAAIMVVADNDYEFGQDGELTQAGPAPNWFVMNYSTANWIHPIATQEAAPANANTSLDVNGKLAPLP